MPTRLNRPQFLRLSGLGLVLIHVLLPFAVATADGGHGGEGGPQQRVQPSPSPSSALLKSWQNLIRICDRIGDDAWAGRLASLRANADLVPDLAQTLMPQVAGLSDSKRSRVKSGVTQLSKISEHLRETASTEMTALMRGDLKRIARALRLISSQFADGSLPLSAHSAFGHSRGHHN